MKSLKIKQLTLLALSFLTLGTAMAQEQKDEWIVPPEEKEKVSPFIFTDSTITIGKALYEKNCLSCHGEPTKGNYAQLDPIPVDPVTEEFQENTDGEIYYKIVQGKGLMPSFKDVLTPKERWQIVAYTRSFNEDYVQPEPVVVEMAFEGTEVRMKITYDSLANELAVVVKGKEKEDFQPLENAQVTMFAKRYFGNLPIGETQRTNKQGEARFPYPADLPGNEKGEITFIASLEDSEAYANSKDTTTLAIAHSGVKPSLTAQRAMWNTVKKAPLWLIFAYTLSVLAVWGIIFYIIYQLFLLFKMGKTTKPENELTETKI